jgi:hypothetical protein
MIRDAGGGVILTREEARGVDALIASTERHLRDVKNYTLQEAAAFVSQWLAAKQ